MSTVNRVTILAVGLIGGSLAKALKQANFAGEIVGWGRRQSSLEKALQLGAVDRYSLDLAEAVDGADIIVVATPTLFAEKVLAQLAELVKENTVITDVASAKGNILAAAERAFGRVPPNLVLGHPIAGSEQSGVAAARADLFVNHKVILTPTEQTSLGALQLVTEMWEATGAELSSMPVAEHDDLLAATSHLPHVLAFALVDALAGQQEHRDIFRFAAGGFRDFTRIASSDPTMWQEIALANRDSILKMLDVFSDKLGELRSAIDDSDGEAIIACFERAKGARDQVAGMLEKQQARD